MSIPNSHKDLLEGPIYVVLTTIMPDGMPQSTPVWCDLDGEFIRVNTARGRQKEKNVNENPKVNVFAIDPKNPFRYIEVRGKVVEVTEKGALEHIDSLAKLYVGKDSYYGGVMPKEQKGSETRVILRIKPVKVVPFAMG